MAVGAASSPVTPPNVGKFCPLLRNLAFCALPIDEADLTTIPDDLWARQMQHLAEWTYILNIALCGYGGLSTKLDSQNKPYGNIQQWMVSDSTLKEKLRSISALFFRWPVTNLYPLVSGDISQTKQPLLAFSELALEKGLQQTSPSQICDIVLHEALESDCFTAVKTCYCFLLRKFPEWRNSGNEQKTVDLSNSRSFPEKKTAGQGADEETVPADSVLYKNPVSKSNKSLWSFAGRTLCKSHIRCAAYLGDEEELSAFFYQACDADKTSAMQVMLGTLQRRSHVNLKTVQYVLQMQQWNKEELMQFVFWSLKYTSEARPLIFSSILATINAVKYISDGTRDLFLQTLMNCFFSNVETMAIYDPFVLHVLTTPDWPANDLFLARTAFQCLRNENLSMADDEVLKALLEKTNLQCFHKYQKKSFVKQ